MADESPKMSPQSIDLTNPTITFAQCLTMLVAGKKCRRLAWEDKGVYVVIQNEQVMLYKTDDKKLHPLIVSIGDIEGTDWIVVESKEKMS
ncbi:MAG: DUF2829 domain-containing protein [Candidatus Methanoperedens sp.]|nr:DUF2829 domain-containing protein [Candidatus Methanoperedens sp.]